jgi:hypothetical protein
VHFPQQKQNLNNAFSASNAYRTQVTEFNQFLSSSFSIVLAQALLYKATG